MSKRKQRSILGDALRGAMAGAAATWVMDLVTTGLMENQSEETTQREQAVRPNGKSAVGNLIDRAETMSGTELTEEQRTTASYAIHYGLGVVPGALYAVFRRRVPLVGAAQGLAYGVFLWAVADEYLNSRLGLAAEFGAYPPETHWRGLVGHAVLGVATDTGIELLGG